MAKTLKKPLKSKSPQEYEELGRAVESLLDSEFLARRQALKNRFLLGMAAGAGSVIGASVLIALLLWVLSIFGEVPLLGPVVDNIRDTVKEDAPR